MRYVRAYVFVCVSMLLDKLEEARWLSWREETNRRR